MESRGVRASDILHPSGNVKVMLSMPYPSPLTRPTSRGSPGELRRAQRELARVLERNDDSTDASRPTVRGDCSGLAVV